MVVYQTGGTIDKRYLTQPGNRNFAIRDAAAKTILARARLAFKAMVFCLLRKDSQDITDFDRQRIRRTCEESRETQIIITHGTDTMTVTAEALEGIEGKTIVLTGAILPEQTRNSDADFNMGMAVAAVQLLPPGVYVAMSGQVMPWKRVDRDDKGLFIRRTCVMMDTPLLDIVTAEAESTLRNVAVGDAVGEFAALGITTVGELYQSAARNIRQLADESRCGYAALGSIFLYLWERSDWKGDKEPRLYEIYDLCDRYSRLAT